MKVTNKNDDKKLKIKKKPIDKSKKQKVVVIAQEIKFARLLSGNEKKTRDRVLRALKKWLLNCFEKNYEFKEDDFTRVWKGLFYAVWMSDKPLVQEDLCESIAGILDLFPPKQLHGAMLLTCAGFKAIATEWFGIDQHRIDKFLMLVRRYLRASLRCVRRCSWSEDACRQFANMLSHKDGIFALKTPLYARNATSMALHIADCYLEEISKVSSGEIPPDSLCVLLSPFVSYLSQGSSPPLCVAARRVITDLIAYGAQEDHDEEIEAEEEEGEENESSGDGEQVGDENGDEENGVSDNESTEGPLDPRAGRVDVALRPLAVPAAPLAALLRAALPRARGAAHRRARRVLAALEQYMSGPPPPPSPPPPVPPARPQRARSVRALRALEKRLVADGDELALRGLSRKHRKRLLAKSRAGHSIVDDAPHAQTDKHTHANGDWQVEETGEIKNTKKKRKQANKENVAEPKNKRQKLDTPQPENSVKVIKKKKNAMKPSVNNVKKVQVKSGKDKVVKNGKVEKCVEVKANAKESKGNVKISDVKETKSKEAKTREFKKSKVKEVKVNLKPQVKVTESKKSKEFAKATKTDMKIDKATVNKIKKFQKQDKANSSLNELATPKKVKFALKNNSMQGTLDYYKSVRKSPSIPFDSSKQPAKTNLKVNTPSPINPFFKKKMTRRASFAANIVF